MQADKSGWISRRWGGGKGALGTALALGLAMAGVGAFRQALLAADDADNGTRLVEAGRYAEAVPALEKAAANDPRNAGIQLSLGIAFQHLGRYQDAVRALEAAVQIRPDLPQAHRSLALVQEALAAEDQKAATGGRVSVHWDRARASWERYQAMDPSPAAQEMAGRHLAKIRAMPR